MPFVKGKSGNPGGRPKEEVRVRDLARAHTEAAIARLAYWMASDNAKASVGAATALLDRAWGKPTQPIAGDDDAEPIRMETRPDLSKLTDEDLARLRDIASRVQS